jgi:hypothetical protein
VFSGCSEKHFLLLLFLFVVVMLITFLAFLVHGCNSVLSRHFFFFGGGSHSLMPFSCCFVVVSKVSFFVGDSACLYLECNLWLLD